MRQRFKYLILAIALIIFAIAPKAYADSAEAAFRAAYENRYTWDKDFPGYSAEVSVNYGGREDRGIVRVTPDLDVEVTNIDDQEMRQLVENQVKMEVVHRRRASFDEVHGEKRFQLKGNDENGTITIAEVGDEMNSYYKVKDRVIEQVNRTFDDVAVTVDAVETRTTPEGYLVEQFQTTYRDAKTGEMMGKEDIRDSHQKIGKYYLLSSRDMRYAEQGDPAKKMTPDAAIDFNFKD